MSAETFEETKKLILDINEVVSAVDSTIKQPVFDILVGRFLSKSKGEHPNKNKQQSEDNSDVVAPDTSDLGTFISAFDTKKPVDALMVLVAWLYSQYGSYAMSLKEIKELGDSCGLTLPARMDMTLRQAKSKGKNQFIQQAKAWKLTVSGELAIKEAYGVTKGTTPLPEE